MREGLFIPASLEISIHLANKRKTALDIKGLAARVIEFADTNQASGDPFACGMQA
jgi:hypothetical protein